MFKFEFISTQKSWLTNWTEVGYQKINSLFYRMVNEHKYEI